MSGSALQWSQRFGAGEQTRGDGGFSGALRESLADAMGFLPTRRARGELSARSMIRRVSGSAIADLR